MQYQQNKNFDERIFPQEIKELESFKIYSVDRNNDFYKINFHLSLPADQKCIQRNFFSLKRSKKNQIQFSDLIFMKKNNFFLNENNNLVEVINGKDSDDLISLVFKNNSLMKKLKNFL